MDAPETAIYALGCTDCSFQTTVVGEFETVLDTIETHQQEREAGPYDHFVNVSRRD